jgi:FkbM family methyltransferase
LFSKSLARFASVLPSSLKYPLSGLRPIYTFVMGVGEPVIEIQTAAGPLQWRVDDLTSQFFVFGTYEPYMQAAFVKFVRPGSTVYDVGAYAGYHTLLCALLVGDSGHAISFEPNPENFRSIQGQLELNSLTQVKLSGFALSDECGERKMDTSVNRSQGWLSATGDLGVEAHTCDCLVETEGFPPPDVIKIDVEGHEEEVIRGAMKTIRKYRPVILCDHNDQTTFPGLESILMPLGYTLEPGPPIVALHKERQCISR